MIESVKPLKRERRAVLPTLFPPRDIHFAQPYDAGLLIELFPLAEIVVCSADFAGGGWFGAVAGVKVADVRMKDGVVGLVISEPS
jgi:hypothetical protein